VDEPGRDRGVVFQSPCLLPWLSAGENVTLAVAQAFPKYNLKQRKEQAEKYLELVGISGCYDQKPAELSLGTQQCVSLARALSMEPGIPASRRTVLDAGLTHPLRPPGHPARCLGEGAQSRGDGDARH
jgi:ABC-type taurine transport system ATPase subunit